MPKKSNSLFFEQILPLILTVVIAVVLTSILYLQVNLLNTFTISDIITRIRFSDILVGLTIYLKTSVDFAIFIGNLMSIYPGWKNRVAIEIGTAFGNALGTMVVLTIWAFFKEVEWLLAVMIFIAALVLLRMAQDGLHHAEEGLSKESGFKKIIKPIERGMNNINNFFAPFLNRIVPHTSMRPTGAKTLFSVFILSFTIPFILGLDDFAGYVPLFDIVNVFGFSIGVLAGHMILNAFLFLSPQKTITVVKNAYISFVGALAFIGLAIWGFWEVYKILFGLH